MKRKRATDGSSPPFSHPKNVKVQKESPPDEIAGSPPIGMMNYLPIELMQKILYSLTLKERLPLRLVNKAMLDVVDASMSDVQEIEIECKKSLKDGSDVKMTTINPYNGVKEMFSYNTVHSSLSFLVKWAGAQLKALKLIINPCIPDEEDFLLGALYRTFEALNGENACPKLKILILNMGESIWHNNEIIPSELLKYVTKRQLQVKAIDQPTPFLHSLSLISEPNYIRPRLFAIDPPHCEKRRKFLQDLLDQCRGLKELEVESLLVWKNLPIVALRYPTTLTYLKALQFGTTPEHLPTLINDCPNLQIVNLDGGFPCDNADVHALASLFELRELTLAGYSTKEKIAQMTAQCLAAFEDHPFGASIARPWPQLKLVAVNCRGDEHNELPTFRFLVSGTNCSVTSLHLTVSHCLWYRPYVQSVENLFQALNSKNACPNLMELRIDSCELFYRIKDSLAATKDREPQALQRWLNKIGDNPLPIPKSYIYDMLNGLLTFVTKRQSAVRLGKPFLRSLSIGKGGCSCFDDEGEYDDLPKLRDQLEQIHTTLQQILDQCHGLEDLYIESLELKWINPNKKKGRELMELVPLRFPTTLKKLNGVWLD